MNELVVALLYGLGILFVGAVVLIASRELWTWYLKLSRISEQLSTLHSDLQELALIVGRQRSER